METMGTKVVRNYISDRVLFKSLSCSISPGTQLLTNRAMSIHVIQLAHATERYMAKRETTATHLLSINIMIKGTGE